MEKKAEDIKILDLTKLDTVTDYFVICTGEVNQQVKAIATHVERSTREALGQKAVHREGLDSLNWVLVDYIDVVVHIFRPSFRDYYRLEDLWSDADVYEVVDQAEPVKRPAAKKPVKRSVKSTGKSAAKRPATKKSAAKKIAKSGSKKAVKKAAKTPRAKRSASA